MKKAIEERFWQIFRRVLKVEPMAAVVAQEDLEEWDSLKHIELVFELEEAFDISIEADDIVTLFSDTATVLDYLRDQAETAG